MSTNSSDTMVEIEDTTDGNTSNSTSGSNFTRNEILKHNKMDISHTSSASIMFRVSDGATAAIASDFLHDLIEARYLGPGESYLIID